jgi:hypothetical protein
VNAVAIQARLDVLATEIRRLRAALVELEREAFDVAEEPAIERAAITRGRLEAALALYFEEAERLRKGCLVHGPTPLWSCPECLETAPSATELGQ